MKQERGHATPFGPGAIERAVDDQDAWRMHWLMQTVRFVDGIGIEVRMVKGSCGLFAGIRIRKGALEIDPDTVFVGDILHEAGHVAILPSQFRPLASGDLKRVGKAMDRYLEAHGDGLGRHPEDPVCRAILQSGDSEATAWQFAAAHAIGLPSELIFPAKSFGGSSAQTLAQLRANAYMGINGLQAAGWTAIREANPTGLPRYPALARWLGP